MCYYYPVSRSASTVKRFRITDNSCYRSKYNLAKPLYNNLYLNRAHNLCILWLHTYTANALTKALLVGFQTGKHPDSLDHRTVYTLYMNKSKLNKSNCNNMDESLKYF